MKKLLMTIVLMPMMAMALELSPSFAPEAVAAYKIKAEVGEAEAQFLYAWALSMGSAPGKHNPAVAFDNAKKSAGQGFELAYRLVGLGFAEGWNGSSNVVEAAAWYGKFFSWAKPAAEKGNAWAQLQLGQCYEKGRGIEKNPKEAAKWYRKAAEQGCAIAQSHLALCYAGGVGVERDEKEELNWERKAAEQGVYASQVNLGLLYGNGDIVERDPAEAVKWYRKAAGQGFSQAQCLLGLCYRRGIGVEINHAEAVKWYSKAAKAGYTDASYRLWLYYVNGEGVEKNLTEAASWYCKLAKNEWKPRGDPLKTDELLANLIGEKGLADNMKKVYDSLMALGKELKDCPAEVKAYYEKDLSFAKGKLEQEKKSRVAAARAGSNSALVKVRPAAGNRRAQRKQEDVVDGYTWSYRVSNGGATISSVLPKPSGNVSIPLTLGGVPVKGIGEYVFMKCEGLMSVMIPSGVTNIGQCAFFCCSGLTSVIIPDGVVSIGNSAFYACRGLRSVKIPESVVNIDHSAFSNCNGLSSVSLPSNLKSVGNHLFGGCERLTSVRIPIDVTNIGSYSFYDCKKLTSILIPKGVTNIGARAFIGCSALTSMLIPTGVRSIGPYAFAKCTGLTSMMMCGERPDSQNSNTIFSGCKNLKSIHVPSNCKSWAGMKEWQGIPLVFDGAKADEKIEGDKSTHGKNIVAEKLQSYDFLLNKNFKKNAKFYLCLFSASWCPPCRREMPRIAKAYAETLMDDPDIELIHFSRDQNDEKALAWAKEHDVKFPVVKPKGGNSLDLHTRGIPHLFIVKADGTLLEEGHPMRIFNEEKFREIKGDNPAVSVKQQTENGSVATAENKDAVDGYTWSYRVNNGEATIVANVEGHPSCAVAPKPTGHFEIPSTIDGAKVTHIGNSAFYYCDGLESVTIPDGVTSIGNSAFQYCRRLSSVTIPNSVKSIGGGAFYQCWSLRSLAIPSGVTDIGDGAFMYCNRMQKFEIDPSNKNYKSVNGLLLTKDGSRLIAGVNGEVVIPSGVKSIVDFAFLERRMLTSVTIPEGVTSIGRWAFFSCSEIGRVDSGLSEITLPASVTSIGERAFGHCSGLKRFVVRSANKNFRSENGLLLSKDGKLLIAGINGEIDIPNGVTSIEKYAFDSCRGLTKLTIPANVESVGTCAFSCCANLTSVMISSSVTNIGKSAFHGCSSLSSVTMCGERPNSLDSLFGKCKNLKSIHVPANCKSWTGMKEWQGIPLVFDAESE